MARVKNIIVVGLLVGLTSGPGAAQFLWGTNGIPLRPETDVYWNSMAVKNSQGDIYLAWSDSRGDYPVVWCQKFNVQGERLWSHDRDLYYGSVNSIVIEATSDDGVVVAWGYSPNSAYGVIKAQKLNSSGMMQWQSGGVLVGPYDCSSSDNVKDNRDRGSYSYFNLAADTSGGIFIVWSGETHYSMYGILAQHLLADGSISPGWGSYDTFVKRNTGFLSNEPYRKCMCADGEGGFILSWHQYVISQQYVVYGQRVDGEGNVLWGNHGLLIHTWGDQASVCRDEAGGAYFVWELGSYLYAQHVSHEGQSQWPSPGVAVTQGSAPSPQVMPQVIPDGVGGVLTAWWTGSSSNYDLYCQRISEQGSLSWGESGVALSTATGTQRELQIDNDGNGGILAAWNDYTNYDLYAQHISADGQSVWQNNGIIIRGGGDKDAFRPVVLHTEETNAFYAWYEHRNTRQGIYLQKTDASGQLWFEPEGLAVGENLFGGASSPALLPLLHGCTLSAWMDTRNINTNTLIYYQIFDSTGNMFLPASGIPLCNQANGKQTYPYITETSDNGAIFAWMDYRDLGNSATIYTQKINAQGQRLWDEAGVRITDVASSNQDYHRICSDGVGGAYVFFKRSSDLFIQRLDANGNRLFGGSGLQLTYTTETEYPINVASDNENGALVVYRIYSQAGLFAKRILPTGVVAWTITVSSGASNLDYLALPETGGNMIVLWSISSNLYAQKIDNLGRLLWGPTGAIVTDSPSIDHNPAMAVDGNGYLYVAWVRSYGDIYCQWLNPHGVQQLPAEGVRLSHLQGEQSDPQIMADNAGGAYVAWRDWPSNFTTRLTHVDSQGQLANPVWTPGGNPINQIRGGNSVQNLIPDGSSGTVLLTSDVRGSFVQRVNDNVTMEPISADLNPGKAIVLGISPNPFNPTTTIRYQMPEARQVNLRVYDTAGRLVVTLVDGWRNAGSLEVTFDGSKLASGVYLYTLTTGGQTLPGKMVLLK